MEILHKPQVSIIIAVYNQAAYLEKVFLSLLNQSFKDFEIVIADDGSGKEVFDVIERYSSRFKYAVLHAWHADTDFRKTIIVNQAVRMSNGGYLVFIDGDCIVHHRFVERHFMRGGRGRVLSGRRVMLGEEISNQLTTQQIVTKEFEKLSFWWSHCQPKERKRGLFLPFIYKPINAINKNYWIFGSNFSMHKDDFYSLNGYDESIVGRGLEDINLSQRVKLKGLPIMKLTHEAIQFHLFHHSKPVPHDEERTKSIIYPAESYAAKGIFTNTMNNNQTI